MEKIEKNNNAIINIIITLLAVAISLLFLTGFCFANAKTTLPEELNELVINGEFLNNNKSYPCVLNMGGENKTYLDLTSIVWSKDIECPDKSIDHIIKANLITMDGNKPIYHPFEIHINEISNLNRFRIYEFQPDNNFYLLINKDKNNINYNCGIIIVNLIYNNYISKV